MGGPGSATTTWDHNRGAAGPQDRGKPQCRAGAPKPREESSGLGAGLHNEGLEGGPDPHQRTPFLSTCGCRPMFSATQPACILSRVHTHACALCVLTWRHLSRNLLPALISLLHPSRYLWREEGGGQRSEAREAPPASSSLEALWLRDEILPSRPGRCPGREVRAQEAELKIRASAPGAGPVPSPNPTAARASRSKMLGPPTRGGAPEPPRLQGTHPKSSCHIRQDSKDAEAWVRRGQRHEGKKRRQTQRKRDGWGRS